MELRAVAGAVAVKLIKPRPGRLLLIDRTPSMRTTNLKNSFTLNGADNNLSHQTWLKPNWTQHNKAHNTLSFRTCASLWSMAGHSAQIQIDSPCRRARYCVLSFASSCRRMIMIMSSPDHRHLIIAIRASAARTKHRPSATINRSIYRRQCR